MSNINQVNTLNKPKIPKGLIILLIACVLIIAVSFFIITQSTSSTSPTPTTTIPIGRYVKLVQTVAYDENTPGNEDDKNRIINLAEIEVFDVLGTNLAAGKTVSGSSEYPAPHGWSNLTDGNKTNFAHTYGRSSTEYDSMTVDLGDRTEIKKLVITNRTDCCKHRAIGLKVMIIDSDGTTLVKETPAISVETDVYTLTFPENVWV